MDPRKPALEGYRWISIGPRMKRIFRLGAAGLAALLVMRLVGGGMLVWHFDRALEEAKAAGAFERPSPPKGTSWDTLARCDEALNYYRAALSLSPKTKGEELDVLNRKLELWKGSELLEVRTLVDRWADALNLLAKGARFDYEASFIRFDGKAELNLLSLRRLVDHLLLRARLHAFEGRIDEALQDCLTGIRVSDLCLVRHALIDEMVRQAMIRRSLVVMTEVLGRGKATEEALLRAGERLSGDRVFPMLRRCLMAETSFCLDMIRQFIDSGTLDAFQGPKLRHFKGVAGQLLLWFVRPGLHYEQVVYMRLQSAFLVKTEPATWTRRNLREWQALRPELPALSIIAKLAIPNMGRVLEKSYETEARLRAMAATLALRRSGQLPAGTRDPFTEDGRPLGVFTVDGQPFAYSVGLDGVDGRGQGDDLR